MANRLVEAHNQLGPYSLRKLKICLTFESSKLEDIFKEFK